MYRFILFMFFSILFYSCGGPDSSSNTAQLSAYNEPVKYTTQFSAYSTSAIKVDTIIIPLYS
ncbi:hypothetical protein, partial [Caldisericum sp.]|uniref:hypothetical protein n=1 Tax=Caldisericum sp. TaxID=2499687 RepID=UPI003D101C1F